jgi:hypothetical protein
MTGNNCQKGCYHCGSTGSAHQYNTDIYHCLLEGVLLLYDLTTFTCAVAMLTKMTPKNA